MLFSMFSTCIYHAGFGDDVHCDAALVDMLQRENGDITAVIETLVEKMG